MTTNTISSWEQITDVPCPRECGGMLRWDEAGHVPGYRTCEACHAHYLGSPGSTLVRQPGRARRVTAKTMHGLASAQDANKRVAQDAVKKVYGRSLENADQRAGRGPWGPALDIGAVRHAIANFREVGLSDDASSAEARFRSELKEADEIQRSVRALFRDGQAEVSCMTDDAVMIYSVIPVRQTADGWRWKSAPHALLTDEERSARGIWR